MTQEIRLEAPAARRLWIFDPPRDLLLVVATPLLILPLAALSRRQLSLAEISLYVAAFGAMGHHLPGLLRAYGDRELYARFRTRFLVAPVVLVGVCLYFGLRDLHGLRVIAILWGVWHGLAQVYGFSRIYDAKAGRSSRRAALLDRALCVAWFGGGVVFSPGRMFELLERVYESGGPLVAAANVRGAQLAWGIGLALVTLAWLAQLAWQYRRAEAPSPVKLGLMASSFAFWWYCMVAIDETILGVALFEIFHDVQYLAIVWTYSRKRVDQGGDLAAFSRFLFRRSGALVGLYVGLVFAYGSVALLSDAAQIDSVRHVLLALVTASGFLHFYYDAFIWSVRDGATQRGLGIAQSAAEAPFRAPPWLGHGARWALFAVPAALLLATEGGAPRAPQLERYREAVAAFPRSDEAHFQLAIQLAARDELDPAIAEFERAIALRPDRAQAFSRLASVQREKGGPADLALALASYQQAQRLDPDDAETLNGLGAVQLERGELAAARRSLERALQLAPELAPAWVNLGAAHQSEGDVAEAEACYRRALALAPRLEGARLNLALLYEEAGRLPAAATELEELLRQRPGHEGARESLARLRARLATGS
jgi:tetratricopeptide (TPR) repeat protein